MILVLLRDIGDIGSIMGGQMSEQKVDIFNQNKPNSLISFFGVRNLLLKILIKLKKNLH